MRVRLTAAAYLASAGDGTPITDFKARSELPDRKHLKMMTRDVRLGIAAIGRALDARPGWDDTAPERRGLFVGAATAASDPRDLAPSLRAATQDGVFDVAAFGEVGIPRVPPLWLLEGLSNNIVGFATAYYDMRGINTNRCDGRIGGLAAVVDGARAIAEGRLDLAVAGGADSLIAASGWLGRPAGEGSGFVVMESGDGPGPAIVGCGFSHGEPALHGPDYGAATGSIDLARWVVDGGSGRLEITDEAGRIVWLEVAPGQ